MRACVEEMEGEMTLLEHRMTHMMSSAEIIEHALKDRTQNIQRLTAISLMLKKMQFVLDLPQRLAQCLQLETFDVAVKYYHVGTLMLTQWTSQMRHIHQNSSLSTHKNTLRSFEKIWDDTHNMLARLKQKLRSNIEHYYTCIPTTALNNASTPPLDDKTPHSPSSELDSQGDAPLHVVFRKLQEHFLLLLQLNEPVDELCSYFLQQHSHYLFDPILANFNYDSKLTISNNLHLLNKQFLASFQPFFQLFQDIFLNEHNQQLNALSPTTRSRLNQQQNTVSATEYMNKSHEALVQFVNSLFEMYFSHIRTILVSNYHLSVENSPQHDIHNDNMTRDLFESWESMASSITPFIRLTNQEEVQFSHLGSSTKYTIRSGAKQLLKETVFHFIQHNRDILDQKIDKGIQTLSIYKQSKLQQQREEQSDTADESHLKQLAQNEASRITSLISQFIANFRQFVDGKEPLVKSSISLFQDRLHSNIFSLMDHVSETTLSGMCIVFSQVFISDNDVRSKTSPTGALILSALCRNLSSKSLRQIEQALTDKVSSSKGASSMIGTSSASLKSSSSSSASNNQLRQYQQAFHQLRGSLQQLSKQFILYYIEKQGLTLSELVKLGIETPQWSRYDVPREVRHMTTVIVHDTEQIASELEGILPDEFNHSESSSDSRSILSKSKSSLAYGKHSTTSMGGSTLSHHRAGSVHDFMNVLESDVMKIFNKKLSSFNISLPEMQDDISRSNILFEICKIVLKTLEECVRAQVFNKNGFQQIQVDVCYLRRRWQQLLPDKQEEVMNRIQGILQSAAENSTEFVPLEEGIVEKIVEESEQR